MTFIVATNVIASRPPERRLTGTPHARTKKKKERKEWRFQWPLRHCQQSTARTATSERRPLERRTLVPIVAILQIVAVLKQQLLLRMMGILSIIYTKGFEYLTDKLISIQGIVTVPTLISTFLFLGRVTVLWLLIILEMTTVHERITVLLTQGW